MPFKPRNSFYLRISPHTALPLYLYIDDRHTSWMSERIFQQVLADLRPLLGPKIKAEDLAANAPGPSSSKKTSGVDVYRGDTYQFAYFFQKTHPHSLLIKQRNFVAAPPRPKPDPLHREQISTMSAASTSQKAKKGGSSSKKRRRVDSEDLDGEIEELDSQPAQVPSRTSTNELRRSQRNTQLAAGGYAVESDYEDDLVATGAPQEDDNFQPIDVDSQQPTVKPDPDTNPNNLFSADSQMQTDSEPLFLPSDAEEEFKKPILKLSYSGFNIFGRCLCLVVEPWPPLPKSTTATHPMFQRGQSASTSRAPSIVPCVQGRDQTPLFRDPTPLFRDATPLGDFRGETPARFPIALESLDTMEEEDDGQGDLMQFSQALNNSVMFGGGGAAEADQDDGDDSVFYGDADEGRGEF